MKWCRAFFGFGVATLLGLRRGIGFAAGAKEGTLLAIALTIAGGGAAGGGRDQACVFGMEERK